MPHVQVSNQNSLRRIPIFLTKQLNQLWKIIARKAVKCIFAAYGQNMFLNLFIHRAELKKLWLINYINSRAKFCHLKKPIKELFRQVFICLRPPPLLGFCLVWSSNFVDSDFGQIQSVKLLQNMVSNRTQHTLPSPSHTLSVYTVFWHWEGGGGGWSREQVRGETVHKAMSKSALSSQSGAMNWASVQVHTVQYIQMLANMYSIAWEPESEPLVSWSIIIGNLCVNCSKSGCNTEKGVSPILDKQISSKTIDEGNSGQYDSVLGECVMCILQNACCWVGQRCQWSTMKQCQNTELTP